jgi:hypothetical protein
MKQPDRLSRSVFWLAITVVCLVIPGCGPLTRSNAVPVAAEKQAVVLELPEARYWGDGDPAAFREAMVASFFREQAFLRAANHSGDLPAAEFLRSPVAARTALSGRVCWSDGPPPGPGPCSRA